LAADVVTADGRLIRASDQENRDLLWALRGGGGNFGVVVNLEFRLRPIAPQLMFRAPAYPEERAKEALRGWREFMAAAPDEVSGLAEFSTIPSDPAYPEFAWGRRVLSLATVYDGPSADGERATEPLLALGDPLVEFSDEWTIGRFKNSTTDFSPGDEIAATGSRRISRGSMTKS